MRKTLLIALLLSVLTGCQVTRDEAENSAWQTYGNDNTSATDWTGGDGAASEKIGNGRVVWIFGDTYRGTITPTNPPSRSPGEPSIANSFVIEENGVLRNTISLPMPTQTPPGQLPFNLWPRDALVEGGKLKLLAVRTSGTGTFLATFSLPGLAFERLQPTPVSSSTRNIAWGINIFETPSHTYMYGTKFEPLGTSDMFVARVPAGDLLGQWQFRTSSESAPWSSSEANAQPMARLYDGAVAQYATNRFVMIGKDGAACQSCQPPQDAHVFSNRLVAFISSTPHGPWQNAGAVYRIPETETGGTPFKISYSTHFHHHDIDGNGMLFSYSVCAGSACKAGGDASVYRPRFIRIKPSPGSQGSASFEAQQDAGPGGSPEPGRQSGGPLGMIE